MKTAWEFRIIRRTCCNVVSGVSALERSSAAHRMRSGISATLSHSGSSPLLASIHDGSARSRSSHASLCSFATDLPNGCGSGVSAWSGSGDSA